MTRRSDRARSATRGAAHLAARCVPRAGAPSRATPRIVAALMGAALLAPAGGCAKPEAATEVPDAGPGRGADAGDPSPDTTATPAAEASEPAAPAGPRPVDRDPEEERRKMSLSRERSAQAHALLDQGNWNAASAQAREALRVHELNVDAMLVLAEIYLKQGKFELAETVVRSILAVDEKVRSAEETSKAWNLRGFAYIAAGYERDATNAFRKAAELDAKNAAAWNNLGARYLEAGDVKTARECFTYAVELDPKLVKARLNLGAALRAERRWTEAEAAMQQALAQKPDYAEAHFDLGVLYLDAVDYPGLELKPRLEKAIQSFTRYRELTLASGVKGPGGMPNPKARVGKRGPDAGEQTRIGPKLAEEYIAVAKKGIEREDRRIEREAKRKEKDAARGAASPAAAAQDTSPAAGAEDASSPSPASGAGPSGATPPASPPGPPASEGSAPRQPGPTPQGPAPQGPAPQGPAPQGPAPQGPAPQAPAPQAPAPQAPAPQAPAPQAPAPQAPAPQSPQRPTP